MDRLNTSLPFSAFVYKHPVTATVKSNRHHIFMQIKIRHRRDIKVRIKHTIVLSVFSVLF